MLASISNWAKKRKQAKADKKFGTKIGICSPGHYITACVFDEKRGLALTGASDGKIFGWKIFEKNKFYRKKNKNNDNENKKANKNETELCFFSNDGNLHKSSSENIQSDEEITAYDLGTSTQKNFGPIQRIFIDEENDNYVIIGIQCQILIIQADSLEKCPIKHQIVCQLSQVSLCLYQVIDLIQTNRIIYVYDKSRMVCVRSDFTMKTSKSFSLTAFSKSEVRLLDIRIDPKSGQEQPYLMLRCKRKTVNNLNFYIYTDLSCTEVTFHCNCGSFKNSWGYKVLENGLFFIRKNEQIIFYQLPCKMFCEAKKDMVCNRIKFSTHGGTIAAFDVNEDELYLLRTNGKLSIIKNWKLSNRDKISFSILGKILNGYPHILIRNSNYLFWTSTDGLYVFNLNNLINQKKSDLNQRKFILKDDNEQFNIPETS